jgi:membrane associated rhomboid family serine protease
VKPFKPPPPIATNSLIGLCVVFQAATTIAGPAFARKLALASGLIPARIIAALAGQADVLPALATFITHMFLHAGWLHLGLNLLFIVWVGRYVEWVIGRGALVGLFLAGGIIGAVCQVAATPTSMAPIVGASGAIAAVFGAYAVLFARSQVRPRTILGITISSETLTSLWYAATWIGLQLLTGLAFNTGSGLQIAIWTHIGGFLAGLVLGRLWGREPQIG